MAPFIVGISGPTCSGKTTIAQYLKSVFPHLTILHEDDFYLPAAQLPYREGFQNWDCAASIDQDRLLKVLDHVKATGSLPADFESSQANEEPNGVRESIVHALRDDAQGLALQKVAHRTAHVGDSIQEAGSLPDILLVEGFLLFGKSMTKIKDAFDLRILLGGKYEDLKRRRDGRTGYNTDEGFWKDPEGFFDLVVWPEYAEEHSFLFKNQDVGGSVDEEITKHEGIRFCPSESVEEMLTWVVCTILKSLHENGRYH